MAKQKLTSVKINENLWNEFKIECIRRKFSFQKLAERSIDLFMKDEDFRKQITSYKLDV